MKNKNKETPIKKNKAILIISVLSTILIAIIAVIVFFILGNSKPDLEKQTKKSLENALAISTIIPDEATPEWILQVEKKNKYELISIEDKKTYAVGTFLVSSPDLYSVAKKVDEINPESSKLEETVSEELKKASIVKTEVTLIFKKTEEGLSPILTSDFLDAYYGGAYRLYEEHLQFLAKEAK